MKKKAKRSWSAFHAYPAHTKTTLIVLLFVAISIPFSLIATLSKTGLFSRASSFPMTPPLPPSCKQGVNSFQVDKLCSGLDKGQALAARYVCYDGSQGSFKAKSCRPAADFKSAAVTVCQKISQPVCGPSPSPTPSPAKTFGQAVELINNKDQISYLKTNAATVKKWGELFAKNSGTVEVWIKLDKGAATKRVSVLFQEGVGNLSLLPVRGSRFRLWFNSPQLGSVMGGSADGQLVIPGHWHHLALTREASSGAVILFLDGKKVGSGSGGVATKNAPSRSGEMIIGGRLINGQATNGFPGIIDEVRLSSGRRYYNNFTVLKKPFVPDKNTRLLWHFDKSFRDEVEGSKVNPIGQVKFVPGLIPVQAW